MRNWGIGNGLGSKNWEVGGKGCWLGTNQGSRGDLTVYYAGTKSFKTRSFICMLKYLGYFY